MLTELQKERISFHLGYDSARSMLTIERSPLLIRLSDEQEFMLVGAQPCPHDQAFLYMDVELCDRRSFLGQVEEAYTKLCADVIDDSLYVAQAGSVTLRSNELTKRRALYQSLVDDLARTVGGSPAGDRVGF
jgi:hypothetical protein